MRLESADSVLSLPIPRKPTVIHFAIPVHDEERTVGVILWKIRKVMTEFGRDFRVVVLDDASTDGTPDVLARYAPYLPLEVIRSERRLGTNEALDRLFRRIVEDTSYPKRDIVVTLQADLTDDPTDVVDLVKTVEGGADIVVGRPQDPSTPLPLGERIAAWLVPALLGPAYRDAPVEDPMSGFRAYRVVVLKKALRERSDGALVASSGRAGHLEILGNTAPHARRIEECPVTTRPHLRVRPSRAKPFSGLGDLLGVRRRLHWEGGTA